MQEGEGAASDSCIVFDRMSQRVAWIHFFVFLLCKQLHVASRHGDMEVLIKNPCCPTAGDDCFRHAWKIPGVEENLCSLAAPQMPLPQPSSDLIDQRLFPFVVVLAC
ncbi:unnamed protein product [Urochloa humidicola]